MSVLLNPGETWAAVKQHMSPLTASQMNCLRRTCGIPLRDHVPYVVIPDSCNTLSVESPLQGKRLGWQVVCSECLMRDCLRSLCSVKSRGFAHLALGVFNDVSLHSMMFHYMIVKTVVLVDIIGMHKTGCFGETRLVLHIPRSS